MTFLSSTFLQRPPPIRLCQIRHHQKQCLYYLTNIIYTTSKNKQKHTAAKMKLKTLVCFIAAIENQFRMDDSYFL